MLETIRPFALAILAAAWGAGCAPGSGSAPASSPPLASASMEARVTLLQTTDLHDHARGAGHVADAPSGLGGYARIAAYVEQVRASCGHPVLLVDSGDWSMGTLYDLTLGRRPLALWFVDALRYDCITLGNHEFDDTPAGLAGILRAARQGFAFRTPIVASNLEPGGDPDLAPYLGPGKAIRRTLVKTLPSGLRVGFLGLMGKDAATVAPAAAPVRFTDYSRDYGVVQALVDQLRNRQGCRLVIALDHAGTDAAGAEGEDVDLARRVTGIDVIASGHMHNPLASARTVANGAWRTLICCAGAYGANVSRLDLVLPAGSGAASLEASANPAMTDAVLVALDPPARPDPAFAFIVAGADRELNRALAPVFTQVARFPDGGGDDPARGIYHRVAESAQDLPGNDRDPMPGPNGLGDLCADAARAVANGLLAAGGPDRTPFTAAAVSSGELRGALDSGAAITFADVYGILPLGLSPDPAQAGTTGEPLVSGYVEAAGLRALCAMQLLAQTGLSSSDYYLNLSGLSYALNARKTETFFASAGAAAALGLTRQRAGEGSALAARAMTALAGLSQDQGAALLAAAAGNPYAAAMVGPAGPAADRLVPLGRVAAAAERDAATGSTRLDVLLMAQAMAAIGPLAAFDPADPACTGPVADLGPGRHRVVLDLYMLLMIDAVQARFGIDAAVYQAARGGRKLDGTPDGLEAILANRINLSGGGPFHEVKSWMAILLYLTTPPALGGHFTGGRITAEYASSGDFRRFPAAGGAVRTRNAAYPLERIGALAAMAEALRQVP